MSTWTHVNGGIRVDGIPRAMPYYFTTEKLMCLIGPMWLPYYEALKKPIEVPIPINEAWMTEEKDECRLPCGSEGSLQYRIIHYDTGLPWVMIPVWETCVTWQISNKSLDGCPHFVEYC